MFKYLKMIMVILAITPCWAFAQGNQHGHADAVTSATPQLGHDGVVVTGTVVCLGCHLKKEKQAKAECRSYGHTNAIAIEKIYDAQGKSPEGVKGKIYQFLHNDKSDELVKDHTYVGKTIIVTGKIYPEANILEVGFFKGKEAGQR